jgi:bifunctional DNase/RNase
MESKIKVDVLGISYSTHIGQNIPFIVILGIAKEKVRIPIIIGQSEALSIAVALDKVTTPRPLSHDVITSLTSNFDIYIKEVVIYEYNEGVYYAKMVCYNEDKEMNIECRPSDGIAIALRLNRPIYTYQEIFDQAGISLDDNNKNKKEENNIETEEANTPIEELNKKQLQKHLSKAIEEENYELAATINKRLKELEQ